MIVLVEPSFEITRSDEPGRRILRVSGELDVAAVRPLADAVRRARRPDGRAPRVVLDLAGVEFTDLVGLRAADAAGADDIVRESAAVRRIRAFTRGPQRR